MRRFFSSVLLAGVLASVLHVSGLTVRAADDYTYDAVHSSVSFKARHLDISWIHGRFNEVDGKATIDRDDPSKSSFELVIKADSIDTANKARDEHLRQPDYFDAKQFPTLNFKSTSVKAMKGGYEVTGDFSMHGKTKRITINLEGGGKESVQNGVKRLGFSTQFALKRSDFDFDKRNIGLIGDEALILIDFEVMRK
ncbi:MAG: YceI family protein [Planctomycetota bacterium]